MAAAKHHGIWVPMPMARARAYMRPHQSRMEAVRKNPAISHQPPSASGGNMLSPYLGGGGSSARKGRNLMKR